MPFKFHTDVCNYQLMSQLDTSILVRINNLRLLFHTGKDSGQYPRKDVLSKQILRSAREYFSQLIENKYDQRKRKR